MAKSRNKKRKARKAKKNSNKLPSFVEIVVGASSAVIVAASWRTGAGAHGDKRRKKARKHDWKSEETH